MALRNIVDRAFELARTGAYRVRTSEETQATSSPSMDISRASNFERFIFDVTGRDAKLTGDLFGQMVKDGGFSVEDFGATLGGEDALERIRGEYGFRSGKSTHADRVATIRAVYEEHGVLIDPHTADGVFVARGLAEQVDTPIVVLETALPVKFGDTIAEAIGQAPAVPERFAGIMEAGRHVTDLPHDAEAVKQFIADAIERTDVTPDGAPGNAAK